MKKFYDLKNPNKQISYWTAQKGLCFIIFLTGILYNFGMLVTPTFEGILIDALGSKDSTFQQILFLSLLFVGIISAVQIARLFKRYTVRRFANNSTYLMRKTLYNNILNESYFDLEKEDVGKVLTRMQSDCFQTVEGMRKLTTEIFDTVFLFLFYFIYLFLYDALLTAIVSIPIFLGIFFAFFMRKKIFNASSEAKKVNSSVSSQTYSLLDNAFLYRLYGRDTENLKEYDKILKKLEKKNVRSELLTNMTLPLSNIIALLGLIPILFIGTGYIIQQKEFLALPFLQTHWTVGSFTTYVSIYLLLSSKASHTAKLFSSVEKGFSSWKRIKPYIKPYQEFKDAKALNGDSLIIKDLEIDVQDKKLISSVNLKAKKGQIIAVTGKVASGKSVLGKIFLQEIPYKGSVMLFGKELRDFSFEEIKGNIVYMGHDSQLLTKTIKDNIAYGEEKDVLPYLNMVSFNEDLKEMPLREDTMVGNEGVKLSGGQQQRISLARTLYHKKNLIILDDPFSSVDQKTEEEIIPNLKKQAKDSIVFFISHRLSFFKDCDIVCVINDDKSVSIGNHLTLAKENKTYQELLSLQKGNK